jgi:hypothetical protein
MTRELEAQDIRAFVEFFRLLDSWDQRRKSIEVEALETSQS